MPIPSAEEMRQDSAKRAELQEIADMVVKVMLADVTIDGEAATIRAHHIVKARNRVLNPQQGGYLPPQRPPARVGELGPTTHSPVLGQAHCALPSED